MNKAPVERSHVPDPIQLSASHWFEFETEVLSQEESLDGLSRINQDLLEQIAAMGSPQRVLLDIDGQTPVCGEPQPLPEVDRRQEPGQEVVVRDDAGFAIPEVHETPERPEVMQRFPTDSSSVPEPPNEPAIDRARGAVIPVSRELPAPWPPARALTATTQQLKRIRPHKPWWIAVAAVVTALGIASIAYSNRHPASPLGAELQKSNILEQQAPFASTGEQPTNSTTTPMAVPIAAERAKVAKPRHQRVRVRGNEVDIGEDVTVRYLAPQQSAVPPTTMVPSASQPADASLPEAEVSNSPKLAR
jgi:hypothetical protein